jgi:hypothetical protein
MSEQIVEGVVSAEVDEANERIVEKGMLGEETAGARRVFISWSMQDAAGKAHFIEEQPKTLTERFNESYDDDARREDEEFVKNLKRYHRRRFSDEW